MEVKQIEEIEPFVAKLIKDWGPLEGYYTPTEKCKNFFMEEFVSVCNLHDDGGGEYQFCNYAQLDDMIEEIAYNMKRIYKIPGEEFLREACNYVSSFFEERYPDCWERRAGKPWWNRFGGISTRLNPHTTRSVRK